MGMGDSYGCTSTLRKSRCELRIHISASGDLPRVGIKEASGWFLFPGGHVVCPDCAKKCVDLARTLQEQFQ